MIPNISPWIKQLNRTRPVVPLGAHSKADVAIVGGGIAGVVTAFFTLRDTKENVVLLEADKIAHGATGHNAGQITSYFERPLSDLAKEFGLPLAIDGQRAVESGWMLLDEIIAEAKLQTPIYRFTGYAGLSGLEQILIHLKDNQCRVEGGLPTEEMFISSSWKHLADIPQEFKELYRVVPHKDLLNLLETKNSEYVALLSYRKGCMNSALFSEELVSYLATTYAERFSFYEGSKVETVSLEASHATLSVGPHIITTKRVVLCTNGFENFKIHHVGGDRIDTDFHHTIAGRIGYMSAYVEPLSNPPTAISYFTKTHGDARIDPTGESYFYLTRRPHEHESGKTYNLISAGGPDKVLPNGAVYDPKDDCSEEMRASIDEFLRSNYHGYPKEENEYPFCWHGLMGYTPTGVRRVGPEPINPVLLYNLGCNGVGILPSIYGGKRISQFLKGESLPSSLFDPHDQRWENDTAA